MSVLVSIILSTSAIAALSLVGIALIFLKGKHFSALVLTLVALSAGAMLGNVAFHLLPETFEMVEDARLGAFIAMALFVGAFVLSFLFERLFVWHHCHSASHHGGVDCAPNCHRSVQPYAQLVLVSDTVHNFIDGLIVAASFVVSPALGLATTFAIALHEVPQELGDYAVLVHGGYAKRRALLLNAFSASTVILGGVVGYFVTTAIGIAVPVLVPFAAGGFLYIATSDLLPELKHEEEPAQMFLHAGTFLLGIVIMAATSLFG